VSDKIKIKWVRSSIGCIKGHRATIRALGFKKLNQIIEKEATPQILGMVRKVSYLLEVEEGLSK